MFCVDCQHILVSLSTYHAGLKTLIHVIRECDDFENSYELRSKNKAMKKPEEILKEWMKAVNHGEMERLLALYDEKAVLVPTFSNRLLDNPKKIREYFANLFRRENLSIVLHEKTLAIQSMNNNMYALFGIYCWRFTLEEELFSFEARFSYVLDLALPGPIVHHHSSQIPRMI